MRNSEIAISVRGLCKAYTIAHEEERYPTLAGTIAGRLKNPLKRVTRETFWALKDVRFDIMKGDVVGILGRNGAGKSTLLKILSRITEPTAGEVDLYGRVGSLLEVGTGFSGELTGRENIFLNGAILGMNKAEIREQFDAIVDFSGVEQFLDTPVKRYSSGMYVRLAFAVAAHLDPEILIVDEVLAVGDAEFQKKCLGKMKSVSESSGRTVIFVSHNLAAVRELCSSAIFLESGRLKLAGSTDSVVERYLSEQLRKRELSAGQGSEGTGFRVVRVVNEDGEPMEAVAPEAEASLELQIAVTEGSAVTAGFTVYNQENVPLIISNLAESGIELCRGDQTYRVPLPVHLLRAGSYRIEGAVWDASRVYHQDEALFHFEVLPSKGHIVYGRWSAAQFVLRDHWIRMERTRSREHSS
jgi:lipopolysaccharide transport system ATP-binding protein